MARAPHNARMFALGGDAFPHDTQSLRAALSLGAKSHGAGDGAAETAGEFPSLESLRMNLTGVRLDSQAPFAKAAENAHGGFFTRTLDIAAEPALLAAVPLRAQVHAEDCVFAFGSGAEGARIASLQSCANGTLEAAAATADIEAALLKLARVAASKHGAEVESVRLTLHEEGPRAIAVKAVAVAKAMFFTATLTILGRIALDDDFDLRLSGTTCTGDGMIANLAAAQLRPLLAQIETRTISIRRFLPAGMHVSGFTLAGGESAAIRATLARA